MPNELEQLQLSVRLVDEATPGLENIRRQLSQIVLVTRGLEGGGTREATEYLRKLGDESEKAAKALVPFGKGLAFTGGMMGLMGVALVPVVKQLSDFASEGLRLGATAKMLGLLPGYFQSLKKQLSEGMTPEQAEKNLTNFALRLQDLGQANNEARANFIRQGGGTPQMKLLADEMIALSKEGKIAEAWNLWMQSLKDVSNEQLAKGVPKDQVARNARAMLEGLGIGEEALNIIDQILHNPTPEELAQGDARVKLSTEYNKQYTELVQTLEKFEEKFKTAMLGPLTDLNKWLSENAGEWGASLGDFIAATGRELGALIKLVENLAEALRGIGQWMSSKSKDKAGQDWQAPSEFGPMDMPNVGQGSTAGHSAGAGLAQRSSVFLDKQIQKDTENTDQLTKLNRLLTDMMTKKGSGDIPIDTSQMRYNQPGAPTSASAGARSSALADERSARFGKELKDPRVRDRLMAYTNAETGAQGSEAQQAFMESIFNRASARNQTLAKTLSGSYFPKETHQKAARGVGEETRNAYAPIVENVVGGANMTSFATGNASEAVGFGGGATTFFTHGDPGTYAAKHPERYGQEADARDQRWATKMAVASPFTTDDIGRSIMDRSMGNQFASNEAVNAKGSLNVEVRAPDNTTVEAEGKGMFNTTNTTVTKSFPGQGVLSTIGSYFAEPPRQYKEGDVVGGGGTRG